MTHRTKTILAKSKICHIEIIYDKNLEGKEVWTRFEGDQVSGPKVLTQGIGTELSFGVYVCCVVFWPV